MLMPKIKQDAGEGIVSETGKWNTSKEYSQLMIMKLLFECNQYQDLCYHGTSEIVEEFIISDEDKTRAKLLGLKRYITTLKMLCSNTIGQIKEDNKKKFRFFKSQLELFLIHFDSVSLYKRSDGIHGTVEWLEINSKSFNFILKEIIQINEAISEVLTEEDLVFYNVEEFNMDKAKEEFTRKFTDEG